MNNNCNCLCHNHYGTQENDRLIREDREKRRRVEKRRGKPFTDGEWFYYTLDKALKRGERHAEKLQKQKMGIS